METVMHSLKQRNSKFLVTQILIIILSKPIMFWQSFQDKSHINPQEQNHIHGYRWKFMKSMGAKFVRHFN